jgi:hypothetical protein
MTEKQFHASKWKPFEIMTVYIEDLGRNCECYLIGVEFEDKIMKLRPLDNEMYEDDVYEVPIKIITRGKDKSKLRIIK